jgi:hypothetical protein
MKNINEIIEDIQQAQIDAGGRFLRQAELREMKVESLLKLLVPNNVEFVVKHNKLNTLVGEYVCEKCGQTYPRGDVSCWAHISGPMINVCLGKLIKKQNNVSEIKDSDIATIEALHDSLLDRGVYALNHPALKKSRELTAKLHKMVESIKIKLKL